MSETTNNNNLHDKTIDLETLNAETDGEYVIHNINKSIHPVHVMFRKLVNKYAPAPTTPAAAAVQQNSNNDINTNTNNNLYEYEIDPSTAALNLMKELKAEFPNVILVKRIKIQNNTSTSNGQSPSQGKKSSYYRYMKYHRMDAISKISHVISTKRFNNRKRSHTTTSRSTSCTNGATNSTTTALASVSSVSASASAAVSSTLISASSVSLLGPVVASGAATESVEINGSDPKKAKIDLGIPSHHDDNQQYQQHQQHQQQQPQPPQHQPQQGYLSPPFPQELHPHQEQEQHHPQQQQQQHSHSLPTAATTSHNNGPNTLQLDTFPYSETTMKTAAPFIHHQIETPNTNTSTNTGTDTNTANTTNTIITADSTNIITNLQP